MELEDQPDTEDPVLIKVKEKEKLIMVVHTFNYSTHETEAGKQLSMRSA